MEIERKFLLPQVIEGLQLEGVRIRQGYLSIEPNATEVRVREEAGKCTLTVKSGSGMARSEVEIYITAEQFDGLWPATVDRRIVKCRSTVELDGVQMEIDEYEGSLAGLRVVEIEFASEVHALGYEQPAWFGEEVTNHSGYKNAALSVRGVAPGTAVG